MIQYASVRVLRPEADRRLRVALERLVKEHPELEASRTQLLRPLDLLRSLSESTGGALRGDPLGTERMHLIVTMAASDVVEGHRRLLAEADRMASHNGTEAVSVGDTESERRLPTAGPRAGVVDLGGLVLVAMAAGRVGRQQGSHWAGLFVDVVEGLALAAAPAEAAYRAIESGLPDNALALVLASPAPGVFTKVLDAVEQRRFRCIRECMRRVRADVKERTFESVLVSPIESVTLASSSGEGIIHLRVHVSTEPSVGEPTTVDSKLEEALEKIEAGDGNESGLLQVVFADRSGEEPRSSSVTRATRVGKGRARSAGQKASSWDVEAAVPSETRAGFLGLRTGGSVNAAEVDRQAIVASWSSDKMPPCLLPGGVPLETLQAEDPFFPAVTHAPRWGARITEVRFEEAGSAALYPERELSVSASIDGELPGLEVRFSVRDWHVLVQVAESQAEAKVPAVQVHAPFEFRTTLMWRGIALSDRTDPVAFEAVPLPAPTPSPPRPHVVLRPIIAPVGAPARRAPLPNARKSSGAGAPADELALPYVADEDLVVPSEIDDPDGPEAVALLQRLDRLSARTKGLEDTVWLAVLPTNEHFVRVIPGSAARALVIASADQDLSLIALPDEEPEAETTRLRLIGRIVQDDVFLTDPIRTEHRRAGPGAPFITEFVVVGLDEEGNDIVVRRVRTVSPTRTGAFAVLLPINEAVVSVELRHAPELYTVEFATQPRILKVDLRSAAMGLADHGRFRSRLGGRRLVPIASVYRPPGNYRALDANLDGEIARFSYEHSDHASTSVEIEATAGSVAKTLLSCPVTVAHPTRRDVDLGFVLGSGQIRNLRVVASDGWNSREVDVAVLASMEPRPRLIPLGPGRYFVEGTATARLGVRTGERTIPAVPGTGTSRTEQVVLRDRELLVDESLDKGDVGFIDKTNEFHPVLPLGRRAPVGR